MALFPMNYRPWHIVNKVLQAVTSLSYEKGEVFKLHFYYPTKGRDTGRITGIQTILQSFLNNSSHESVIVKLETLLRNKINLET